jgi:hypothetical protein
MKAVSACEAEYNVGRKPDESIAHAAKTHSSRQAEP